MFHDGINVIAIDSIHTPIRNVMYRVEDYRVEQKTDFEKLVLEITTDASIQPAEALKKAADVLIQHFVLFSDEKVLTIIEKPVELDNFDDNSLHIRETLMMKLVDMGLSVRALNCLKSAEVETMADLVSFRKPELLKFKNFGKKSMDELDELVRSKGLSFGMNVANYKLDKEEEE